MEKYFDISKNSQNIKCKLYYNKGTPIEKTVLYIHGFAGHKDGNAAKKLAERILTKYKGVALLIFDLPCHGNDIKKKLMLRDCLTYIDIVVDYIKTELHTEQIYSYATSFGGYLVLKYTAEYGNPFVKIALRCPAVNMAEVMMNTIIKSDELDRLLKGKSIQVGFDRKVEINDEFLTDLQNNDICKNDYMKYADDILIIHGTKDEIVPFDVSYCFADNNVIEFVTVENADHRFQNPNYMDIATKNVLDFFSF